MPMQRVSTANSCPVPNLCQQNIESGPLCDITLPDLPALPTAEQLCYPALVKAHESLDDNPNNFDEPTSAFRRGCSYLELALHPITSPQEASNYFDESESDLEKSIDGTQHILMAIHAHELLYQMDIMRLRRERQHPTLNMLRQYQLDQVNLIPSSARPEASSGHCLNRIIVQQLFLRKGRMIFRSTAREGRKYCHTPAEEPHSDRHTFYTLSDNGDKTPMRVQKVYRHSDVVSKLSLKLLLQKTVERHPASLTFREEPINSLKQSIVQWLAAEAQGDPLPDAQSELLNILSHEVIRHNPVWRRKQAANTTSQDDL